MTVEMKTAMVLRIRIGSIARCDVRFEVDEHHRLTVLGGPWWTMQNMKGFVARSANAPASMKAATQILRTT